MTSVGDYSFYAYDLSGNPLPGLSPQFAICVDVATGLAAAQPKITDAGNGVYTVPPSDRDGPHIAGIIDFGVTCGVQFRWQVYNCPTGQNSDYVFEVASSDWSPLAGLAPGTWSFCKDLIGGDAVTPPTVRDLGAGFYAVPAVAQAGQHVAGIISFGPSALTTQSYDDQNYTQALPTPVPQPSPTTVVMEPLTQALDEDYFLALFDRILPASYLAPLKAGGDGYEYFKALAAMGARLSQAVVNLERGGWILSGTTDARATIGVSFHRVAPTAYDVQLLVGTLVSDPVNGRRYILTQPTTIAAADLDSDTLQATASAPGYEYNARGPATAADDEAIPGDVANVVRLVESPAFGDPTLTVTQDTDGTGGTPASLEQLGADRGLPKLSNETADQYRVRVRQLPDTISPGAVDRTIAAYLTPNLPVAQKVYGFGTGKAAYLSGTVLSSTHTVAILITAGAHFWMHRDGAPSGYGACSTAYDLGGVDALFSGVIFHFPTAPVAGDIYAFYTGTTSYASEVIECFNEQNWGALDAPDSTGVNANYNPIALAYDSPFSGPNFWGRLADDTDANAEFVVLVQPLPAMSDCGGAFDDTATFPQDCQSPVGVHGYLAYDVPDGVTSMPVAAYDAMDYEQGQLYAGLYELLQRIRAAGVAAEIEISQAT